MPKRILYTVSTEYTTGGYPTSLTDIEVANGDLVVDYAKDNECLYLKNTNGEIVKFSKCSCPYTKDELDEKFNAMQTTIDALQKELNEHINGPDVEPTTLVEGYQADGSTFIYSAPINFKKMTLEAEIDVSTCLTSDTNENILSIGTDINLWGTDEAGGTGNVIHIYYTRSSYTLQVWVFNGHTATVNTSKVLADTSSGTTASGIVDIIHIKLNTNGLYINDVRYGTPDNVSNLMSLTEVSVGSQEGTTRSYAKYNYIKTVLNESETTE